MRQPGRASESELEIGSRSPNASSSSDHKAAFLLPSILEGVCAGLAQHSMEVAEPRWEAG